MVPQGRKGGWRSQVRFSLDCTALGGGLSLSLLAVHLLGGEGHWPQVRLTAADLTNIPILFFLFNTYYVLGHSRLSS